LAYFNENYVSPQKADDLLNFSCCDLCAKGSGDEHDVTVFSQKLLSCILRTGERYGTSYVIDVLLGSRNMRIKENKHHTLSTWGIGKELSKQDWFELTNRLIEAGFLRKSADFGVLTLTGDAMDTLKERGKIYLTFSPSKGYTEKNKGHR
ncbi:MAG: RQC domain-containing protein, partial [Spirochaetales bacterium]